jgi:hypothetical protein
MILYFRHYWLIDPWKKNKKRNYSLFSGVIIIPSHQSINYFHEKSHIFIIERSTTPFIYIIIIICKKNINYICYGFKMRINHVPILKVVRITCILSVERGHVCCLKVRVHSCLLHVNQSPRILCILTPISYVFLHLSKFLESLQKRFLFSMR